MSSIYKKGRDGYYYYQAYIFNPKTGKKNKRIFHSLGTKELEVAEKKKIDYDLKYKANHNKRFIEEVLIKYRHKFSVIIVITFLFYLLYKKDNQPIHIFENIDAVNLVDIKTNGIVETLTYDKFETTEMKADVSSAKISPIVPDYIIRRNRKLLNDFNQIYMNVTVHGKYNAEGLKLLSKRITAEESSYSNFIICFFLGDETGIELAGKELSEISNEDKQNFWIGMYSLNDVEGEYFDNTPATYSNR